MRGIAKSFGSVQALRGADFVVRGGEVHALLGENGAGKSTLMAIAYGLVRPDAGTIAVRGRQVAPRSPREARWLGLGMVHQHPTAIPALTVAENVALVAGWAVRPKELHRRVAALGERLGLPVDPAARAEDLSVALRQRLEILKALAPIVDGGPGVGPILLLDEPTAVLAPSEAEELLGLMRGFAEGGGAVVLITHKLDEAVRHADRVTVLRRGVVVWTGLAAERSARELAEAMVGEAASGGGGDAGDFASEVPSITEGRGGGEIVVQMERLGVRTERGERVAVWGATLVVRGGEIVGVAAVEGNGQRELLRAVAGVLPAVEGRLVVAQPVAFVPEDRTTEGLIPEMSLTENVVLGTPSGALWERRGRIDWAKAEQMTAALLEEYGVRAPGPRVPAAALSGGNQQKLVLGRALAQRPRVLVAENPTRGLDIHATGTVHARLRRAAAGGAGLLIYSSDLDEVLALADRVVVMSAGELMPAPPGADRAVVGQLMLRGAGR